MRLTLRARWITALVALFVIAAILAFAVQLNTQVRGMSTSLREKSYSSVDALAQDSSVIVVATVGASHEELDGNIPATKSATVIEKVLWTNPRAELPLTVPIVESGEVSVVQHTTREFVAEYPLLQEGTRYILFLRTSLVERAESPEYYVTGVWTGAYQWSGNANAFESTYRNGTDTITKSLTEGDIAAAIKLLH